MTLVSARIINKPISQSRISIDKQHQYTTKLYAYINVDDLEMCCTCAVLINRR